MIRVETIATSGLADAFLGQAPYLDVSCPGCRRQNHVFDESRDLACRGCGAQLRTSDSAAVRFAQTSFIGRYELYEPLGTGAFSTVWLARDLILDRTVALKIPHEPLPGQPALTLRLETEARAAAALVHPNVVRLLGDEVDGSRTILVYECINGPDLQRYLDSRPAQERLDLRQSIQWMQQIAGAVAEAHALGIIHRDIKPSNILLDCIHPGTGFIPKLADLGLARWLDSSPGLTQTGDCLGTPGYMAPELLAGAGNASVASDIYAIGAVLYRVLAGEPLYAGAREAIAHQTIHAPIPSPRERNPLVPVELELIVHHCLCKEPRDRYKSAKILSTDLENWLADRPISLRPLTRSQRFIRVVQRNKRAVSTCAVVAGVVAALLIWLRSERDAAHANQAEARRQLTATKTAVQELLKEAEAKDLARLPGSGEVRIRLVEKALPYSIAFASGPGPPRQTGKPLPRHYTDWPCSTALPVRTSAPDPPTTKPPQLLKA